MFYLLTVSPENFARVNYTFLFLSVLIPNSDNSVLQTICHKFNELFISYC